MNFNLQGVVVPILTPFDSEGALDVQATHRLVDYLIARGVHGVYPCGTTGEAFLLSMDERRRLAEAVVDAAAGRVPVIVHTGAATTAETVALTQHAQAAGADAVAVIPPLVYHHSDQALLQHYVAVTRSAPDLPFMLYNFPAICNNEITFDLVMELREQAPNVVGMKDSSGSLDLLMRLHTVTNGGFITFNGGDGQALAAGAMGLSGYVSGNANVAPELFVELFAAARAGDLDRARTLQRKVNVIRDLLGDGGNLSLFKQIVAKRGVSVGEVRAPLLAAAPDIAEERWRQMVALGIELSSVA